MRSALASVCVLAAGCWTSDAQPIVFVDAGVNADPDAAGDAGSGGPQSVDLLFLIDDSQGMAEEQEMLRASVGVLFEELALAPDLDGDGQRSDGLPVSDVHVGAISTDMGSGGFLVPTCSEPVSGDDGALFRSAAIEGCGPASPPYLDASLESGDVQAIVDDFACIGTLGTGGCGFEQHGQSLARALGDRDDDANADFVRRDSVLAIVIVTDEDDCSVRDGANDVFDTQNAELGPLDARCLTSERTHLESVDVLADALLAVRPDASRLVLATIAGTPPDAQCRADDPACLLDDAMMQRQLDPSFEGGGERIAESCHTEALGRAQPPVRLVRIAAAVQNAGAALALHSVCETDWDATMRSIALAIHHAVSGR